MKIKHKEEFNLTYHFVIETNKNIFLTGKAGTSNTTFLKYPHEKLINETVVEAPTGVTAKNLPDQLPK